MFFLKRTDYNRDIEKTVAAIDRYYELKSELDDATQQFKETGSSPLNAAEFESKLKEMEALKAEYPVLQRGPNGDSKKRIIQSAVGRFLAFVFIVIVLDLSFLWFGFPSAISKICMFWDTSRGAYSITDKINLTVKYPLLPWLVLPADREDIDRQLDSSIQEYISSKVAIDSNYFTWNSDIYLINPSFKEKHFFYDNMFLGQKSDYVLKTLMRKCNALRNQDTSYIDYDIKASFCNHEITKFDLFTKLHSKTTLDKFLKGNLFYEIRKELESYRPLPTRRDSIYVIKPDEF